MNNTYARHHAICISAGPVLFANIQLRTGTVPHDTRYSLVYKCFRYKKCKDKSRVGGLLVPPVSCAGTYWRKIYILGKCHITYYEINCNNFYNILSAKTVRIAAMRKISVVQIWVKIILNILDIGFLFGKRLRFIKEEITEEHYKSLTTAFDYYLCI